MSRSTIGFATLSLLAACGGATSTLYHPQVLPTPSVPDSVFACTRKKLDSLGYKSTALDLGSRRVVSRKVRNDIVIPEATFYRAYDQIEAEVKTGRPDGQTELQLLARTMYERRTSAGPITDEHAASDSVTADALQLGEQCAPKQPS
jgi:hypothetical protein